MDSRQAEGGVATKPFLAHEAFSAYCLQMILVGAGAPIWEPGPNRVLKLEPQAQAQVMQVPSVRVCVECQWGVQHSPQQVELKVRCSSYQEHALLLSSW